MFEGSTANLNWRLFNHKKHLIILIFYGFISKTINTPFGTLAFVIIIISMIRDGFINGRRQIKETDPTYFHVVQPIFLGFMIAVYSGMIILIYQGFIVENGLDSIPQGDIFVYMFVFVAFLMGLVFFPLIVSTMVSFVFYIPYYFSYKIGKYYGANSRNLQYDEMRAFLKEFNATRTTKTLKLRAKFK